MKNCNKGECRIVGACTTLGHYMPPCASEAEESLPTANNSDYAAALEKELFEFSLRSMTYVAYMKWRDLYQRLNAAKAPHCA